MNASEPESRDALMRRAAGILASQLGVPAADAAVIMRIRADARGVPLGHIATEVTAPYAGRRGAPLVADSR